MSNTHIGYKTFSLSMIDEVLKAENIRHMDWNHVHELANEMLNGKYEPGARDVMFMEGTNALGDGFHVFNAAKEAQMPLKVGVKINCTKAEIAVVDQGRIRSAGTVGATLGVKHNGLALACALEANSIDPTIRKPNKRKQLELRMRHEETVDFTVRNFKGIPLASQYAIAKEYESVKGNSSKVTRLALMGSLLRKPDRIRNVSRDIAVLTLYQYLHTTYFANNKLRPECEEKTRACIRDFMSK